MSERVTAYQCDYCGSLHTTESACQRHEKQCMFTRKPWGDKDCTNKRTYSQPDVIYRRFPETTEGEGDE